MQEVSPEHITTDAYADFMILISTERNAKRKLNERNR